MVELVAMVSRAWVAIDFSDILTSEMSATAFDLIAEARACDM